MKVLEEQNAMGKWIPFDLQSFLTEEDGEYTITVRVRTLRNTRVKRSKSRKRATPKESNGT